MNLGEVEKMCFFGLGLYGSWPSVATIKTVQTFDPPQAKTERQHGGKFGHIPPFGKIWGKTVLRRDCALLSNQRRAFHFFRH